MPAISSIIAATAVAASVAGAGASLYGTAQQSKAQAAAAGQQAVTAGLQAQGSDIQGQALGVQQQQQQLQIATQKQAIQLQQQQDDIRRQAANLDAGRRTRDAVRQGIVARAQALSTATNQGAADSGSSALAGAAGSISGRTGNNLTGISKNQELGNSIFDLNQTISNTYLNAQTQNSSLVAQSGQYQSQLLGLQKQIYQAGGQTALNYQSAAAYGGIAAFGSGLSSLGGAVVKNQDALTNMSTYFSSAFGNNGSSNFGSVGSDVTGVSGSAGALY